MNLKWYIYGEVFFSSNGQRTAARNRLNSITNRAGYTVEVWDLLVATFGSWPAGSGNVTGTDDNGNSVPGLRFCYSTTDQALADEGFNDIAAAWAVLQETSSWWSYAAVAV